MTTDADIISRRDELIAIAQAKQEELAIIKAEVVALEDTPEWWAERVDRAEAAREVAQNALAAEQSQVEALTITRDDLAATLGTAQSALTAAQAEVASLQSTQLDRDVTIEGLLAKVSELQEQARGLVQQIGPALAKMDATVVQVDDSTVCVLCSAVTPAGAAEKVHTEVCPCRVVMEAKEALVEAGKE